MRTSNVLGLSALVLAGAVVGASIPQERPIAAAAPPVVAEDDRDELSYGVGLYLGREVRDGFQRDGLSPDLEMVARGFVDGLQDRTPAISKAEVDDVLFRVQEIVELRAAERRLAEDPEFRAMEELNRARSAAQHTAFGAMPGVVTRPSGVQYRVLREGAGASPGERDRVVLTFTSRRLDGRVIREGDRVEAVVGSLKPGAIEILTLMRPGDHWEVAIPASQAYGIVGQPPLLGPSESVFVDVELVAVGGADGEVRP